MTRELRAEISRDGSTISLSARSADGSTVVLDMPAAEARAVSAQLAAACADDEAGTWTSRCVLKRSTLTAHEAPAETIPAPALYDAHHEAPTQ